MAVGGRALAVPPHDVPQVRAVLARRLGLEVVHPAHDVVPPLLLRQLRLHQARRFDEGRAGTEGVQDRLTLAQAGGGPAKSCEHVRRLYPIL